MTTNTSPPTELEHDRPVAAPPGIGKPKKRGLIWVLFLVIVAAIAGYAVWRAGRPGLIAPTAGGRGAPGGRAGRGGFGPLPVVVAKARSTSVPVYLSGLGNVTAFYTVTVKSRVDGQLMKVNFQEGDFVKEGQVLAEIDPRPYQVMLEQAEGTLAHDTALLDNSKVDFDRYQTLLAQDAIPKQQLDTQKALVAQYTGNIKQDQANIDNAKLQLTYSKVTAPITGVVGLRLVDPGNIVHASDANGMIVITQLQPISVLFTIPEDSLPQVMRKLRAGAKLPVDAYNRDNSQKLASGTLLTMDNQIDNTTGTSKLKGVFPNTDFSLFPQQFVNIKLLVDTMQNQIVIPTVAVQNGQQSPTNPTGTFVYVVDDHQVAHFRPVTVLTSDQTGADIKSGLAVGEGVAVDGADRLQDGSQVRIRQAGEAEKLAAEDAAAMANRKKGGKKGGGGASGFGPGGPNGRGAEGKKAGKKGFGGGTPQ